MLTPKQVKTITKMVDKFLVEVFKQDYYRFNPDKEAITESLERVMKRSVLKKNPEVLACAINYMQIEIDGIGL